MKECLFTSLVRGIYFYCIFRSVRFFRVFSSHLRNFLANLCNYGSSKSQPERCVSRSKASAAVRTFHANIPCQVKYFQWWRSFVESIERREDALAGKVEKHSTWQNRPWSAGKFPPPPHSLSLTISFAASSYSDATKPVLRMYRGESELFALFSYVKITFFSLIAAEIYRPEGVRSMQERRNSREVRDGYTEFFFLLNSSATIPYKFGIQLFTTMKQKKCWPWRFESNEKYFSFPLFDKLKKKNHHFRIDFVFEF